MLVSLQLLEPGSCFISGLISPVDVGKRYNYYEQPEQGTDADWFHAI